MRCLTKRRMPHTSFRRWLPRVSFFDGLASGWSMTFFPMIFCLHVSPWALGWKNMLDGICGLGILLILCKKEWVPSCRLALMSDVLAMAVALPILSMGWYDAYSIVVGVTALNMTVARAFWANMACSNFNGHHRYLYDMRSEAGNRIGYLAGAAVSIAWYGQGFDPRWCMIALWGIWTLNFWYALAGVSLGRLRYVQGESK